MLASYPKTVVIVTPWFTPAYKAGGPVQSILHLVSNYNHVHFKIFCSHTDLDKSLLNNITTNQWIKFNEHTMIWYNDSHFPIFQLKKELKKIKSYILYINGFFSFHYNILPLLLVRNHTKIVSTRGMLHPEALQQKFFKKYIFLQYLQKSQHLNKIVFHATNEMEKKSIINSLRKQVNVKIANNYFRQISPINHPIKKVGTLKLITTAIVSPMKNHLLVLKALKENKNTISYHIIGAIKDQKYWLSCIELIHTLPKNIQVFYHGEVHPEFIQRYYSDSPVNIMVSESENFGHAIAESLSAGIPVITTSNTPWQTISTSHAGLLVSPKLNDIKNAIDVFCDMDNNTYQSYAKNACSIGKLHINKDSLVKEYDQLFTQYEK